jgi:hypothetical protein
VARTAGRNLRGKRDLAALRRQGAITARRGLRCGRHETASRSKSRRSSCIASNCSSRDPWRSSEWTTTRTSDTKRECRWDSTWLIGQLDRDWNQNGSSNPHRECFGEGWRPGWPQGSIKRMTSIHHGSRRTPRGTNLVALQAAECGSDAKHSDAGSVVSARCRSDHKGGSIAGIRADTCISMLHSTRRGDTRCVRVNPDIFEN